VNIPVGCTLEVQTLLVSPVQRFSGEPWGFRGKECLNTELHGQPSGSKGFMERWGEGLRGTVLHQIGALLGEGLKYLRW
jgi:hypothetical protein